MSDSPTPPIAGEASGEVPADYVSEETFDELPLSEELRRSIAEHGYTQPTPVQARSLRPALAGRDLIVRSKTGTGKTAAFGIPVLERLDTKLAHVQALALCPTRELALQVAEELSALGKHKGVKVVAIYGGAPMQKQIDELRGGGQVVVGTPGRVYDHIRRHNLDLSHCTMSVLDEADEMLNQGFYEEVTRILEFLPGDRQTLLFSATVTADIERLIKKFTREPETILLSGDTYTVEGITNVLYDMEDAYPKPRNLLYLLEIEQPDNAIIFCNTRDDTGLVTAVLNRNGFDAEMLNGDLPQKERERVMAKVKKGELELMVATDIAARGIDISDLSHVINYSLPEDPAVYLHRVGRTGRIGKQGVAISLVSGRELSTLSALEKKFGIKFEKRKLPSAEDAQRAWNDKHLAEVKDASVGSVFDALVSMAREIKVSPEGDNVIAFLLKYFFTHHRMEKKAQQGGEAAPAPAAPEPRPAQPPRERMKERERRERKPRMESGEAVRSDKPRSDRPPRPPRTPRVEAPTDPNIAQLWVNLGAGDGIDAAQLKALMVELSGLDASKVTDVQVRATHSYVFAQAESADTLIGVTGKERAGKPIRVERPRRGR